MGAAGKNFAPRHGRGELGLFSQSWRAKEQPRQYSAPGGGNRCRPAPRESSAAADFDVPSHEVLVLDQRPDKGATDRSWNSAGAIPHSASQARLNESAFRHRLLQPQNQEWSFAADLYRI